MAAMQLTSGVAQAEATVRDRHAGAAEQRGRADAGRGIGDVVGIAVRQASAAKAVATHTKDVFGASMQVRLRRQLAESRATASAKVSSLGLAPADGNVSAMAGTVSPSSLANKPSMDHSLSDGTRAAGASA